MTEAEVIEELIQIAVTFGPGIADAVRQVVEAFETKHPTLGAPPPVDGIAAIDAKVDAEIAAKLPKGAS